jgi:hypothetical protein
VIKPSGVYYVDLAPESMIVCTLDGTVVDADLAPSGDTAAQAYVHRHMPDAGGAVKAAVMCEDVARTVHISRQLGEPAPIPAGDIDRLCDRYQNVYGQR